MYHSYVIIRVSLCLCTYTAYQAQRYHLQATPTGAKDGNDWYRTSEFDVKRAFVLKLKINCKILLYL